MRRLALAMCAGALGFSLVACGGGAPATSEPAATQEASTDETEATAEEDESTLPEIKQSMLKPFVESFNPKDGMHITYTVSTTFLKEDGSEDYVENFSYDTHIKGNTMFQQKTSLDNPNSVLNSTTAIWNGDLVSLD